MSRTDKTRPWWVQISEESRPVHDHRFGPCTLPREITRETAGFDARRPGCYWGGTAAFWVRRLESHGYREWQFMRRADRRRDRRAARRALRTEV